MLGTGTLLFGACLRPRGGTGTLLSPEATEGASPLEPLSELRTQLGDFFNVLLIGVAYGASSYQLEKFQPGLRLTAEGA